MNANECRERILGRLSLLFLLTRGQDNKAIVNHHSGGGLSSSSGGELKLYLKWKMSGYHADTPITIKAEPSIWPTATFINIHEHPI